MSSAVDKIHVNVKWGKKLFENVEVDLREPPLVFKSQLFTLSGVAPERQKVMVKAKLLKDDTWNTVAGLKDGQTLLLMGSSDAAAVAPPAQEVPFEEDMPEEERDVYGLKKYGAGLKNLGNTCYMNATMQLLYSVPELRESLENYDSQQGTGALAMSAKLTSAAGGLFKEMTRTGSSVMPVRFLFTLRAKYPQFAEMARGVYRQQDAEECFSQVVHCLSESIKVWIKSLIAVVSRIKRVVCSFVRSCPGRSSRSGESISDAIAVWN